ncbi:MAG: TerB family tellurite resistance protein [Litorimonas sp.]
MTKDDALFETVATLFAITVLVDEHEREPEMVEFVHACTVHNHRMRPSRIVTPGEWLSWFSTSRQTILDALDREGDTYKIAHLSRITEPELRRSLLSSMFTISTADHEFHASENALIKVALATWDARPPTSAELERVA